MARAGWPGVSKMMGWKSVSRRNGLLISLTL